MYQMRMSESRSPSLIILQFDHGAIKAYDLYYHREKRPCLSDENDHQLKNRNVHTVDNNEENTCNASNEHVKEDEVSHGA